MVEITCGICQDLIPLVNDGIASEDSINAVNEHIKHCKECRALVNDHHMIYDEQRLIDKVHRKIYILVCVILGFGLLLGMILTNTEHLFANSYIMPFIGMMSYYVLRYKAFYVIPLFILVGNGIINCILWLLNSECIGMIDILMYSLIYSILALVGIIIVRLLQYAFRGE